MQHLCAISRSRALLLRHALLGVKTAKLKALDQTQSSEGLPDEAVIFSIVWGGYQYLEKGHYLGSVVQNNGGSRQGAIQLLISISGVFWSGEQKANDSNLKVACVPSFTLWL